MPVASDSRRSNLYAMRRIRDAVIYLAVGVGVVMAILVASSASSLRGSDVFPRWGGLIATTVIVFAYAVANNRQYHGRTLFWSFLAFLIAMHLGLFAWLLVTADEWRLVWWVAVTPIEYLIVSILLRLFFGQGKRRDSGRRN